MPVVPGGRYPKEPKHPDTDMTPFKTYMESLEHRAPFKNPYADKLPTGKVEKAEQQKEEAPNYDYYLPPPPQPSGIKTLQGKTSGEDISTETVYRRSVNRKVTGGFYKASS
eukprot:TRINITY_DN96337_c0_g1_i1.p1 TRINITY_DN96337_c0_g1~~TRINITY_DN96337_c0_g1_i1.p1  ORF type:complete len:111 (-),score=20.26 TRINITY_DN96337_c0_g1_i1:184-516(-)